MQVLYHCLRFLLKVLDKYTRGELKKRFVLQVYSFSLHLSLLVTLEQLAGEKMSVCKPFFTALFTNVRHRVSRLSDSGSARRRVHASSYPIYCSPRIILRDFFWIDSNMLDCIFVSPEWKTWHAISQMLLISLK